MDAQRSSGRIRKPTKRFAEDDLEQIEFSMERGSGSKGQSKRTSSGRFTQQKSYDRDQTDDSDQVNDDEDEDESIGRQKKRKISQGQKKTTIKQKGKKVDSSMVYSEQDSDEPNSSNHRYESQDSDATSEGEIDLPEISAKDEHNVDIENSDDDSEPPLPSSNRYSASKKSAKITKQAKKIPVGEDEFPEEDERSDPETEEDMPIVSHKKSVVDAKGLKRKSSHEQEDASDDFDDSSEDIELNPSNKRLTVRQQALLSGGMGNSNELEEDTKIMTEEDLLKKKEKANRRRLQKILQEEALKEITIQKLLRRAEKTKKEIEKPQKSVDLPCPGYRYVDYSGNSSKGDPSRRPSVHLILGTDTEIDEDFWQQKQFNGYPQSRPPCVVCSNESKYSHKSGQRICGLACYKQIEAQQAM
eukprot:TRINITY_DN8448_c0_g1_i1.p1 TRINITY_DN8448_c0_g1~~TRINITY_DN8448_c0_g1_i1.p1  ORF type:complete len:415 (+),score=118.39 TRINITY_DN8448_c0_g1_i1:52-1296(+)